MCDNRNYCFFFLPLNSVKLGLAVDREKKKPYVRNTGYGNLIYFSKNNNVNAICSVEAGGIRIGEPRRR